jgi:hypothetical protein
VTATSRWTQVAMLPDGHRLFCLRDDPGHIAIARKPSDTPGEADGGVMWVDFKRHPMLGGYCSIPLTDDEGGLAYTTPTNPETVIALSLRFDWAFNVRGTLVKAVKA